MKKGYIKYNNFAKEKENLRLENFNTSVFKEAESGLGIECQYWTNYNGMYLPNIVFEQQEEGSEESVVSEWKNHA